MDLIASFTHASMPEDVLLTVSLLDTCPQLVVEALTKSILERSPLSLLHEPFILWKTLATLTQSLAIVSAGFFAKEAQHILEFYESIVIFLGRKVSEGLYDASFDFPLLSCTTLAIFGLGDASVLLKETLSKLSTKVISSLLHFTGAFASLVLQKFSRDAPFGASSKVSLSALIDATSLSTCAMRVCTLLLSSVHTRALFKTRVVWIRMQMLSSLIAGSVVQRMMPQCADSIIQHSASLFAAATQALGDRQYQCEAGFEVLRIIQCISYTHNEASLSSATFMVSSEHCNYAEITASILKSNPSEFSVTMISQLGSAAVAAATSMQALSRDILNGSSSVDSVAYRGSLLVASSSFLLRLLSDYIKNSCLFCYGIADQSVLNPPSTDPLVYMPVLPLSSCIGTILASLADYIGFASSSDSLDTQLYTCVAANTLSAIFAYTSFLLSSESLSSSSLCFLIPSLVRILQGDAITSLHSDIISRVYGLLSLIQSHCHINALFDSSSVSDRVYKIVSLTQSFGRDLCSSDVRVVHACACCVHVFISSGALRLMGSLSRSLVDYGAMTSVSLIKLILSKAYSMLTFLEAAVEGGSPSDKKVLSSTKLPSQALHPSAPSNVCTEQLALYKRSYLSLIECGAAAALSPYRRQLSPALPLVFLLVDRCLTSSLFTPPELSRVSAVRSLLSAHMRPLAPIIYVLDPLMSREAALSAGARQRNDISITNFPEHEGASRSFDDLQRECPELLPYIPYIVLQQECCDEQNTCPCKVDQQPDQSTITDMSCCPSEAPIASSNVSDVNSLEPVTKFMDAPGGFANFSQTDVRCSQLQLTIPVGGRPHLQNIAFTNVSSVPNSQDCGNQATGVHGTPTAKVVARPAENLTGCDGSSSSEELSFEINVGSPDL